MTCYMAIKNGQLDAPTSRTDPTSREGRKRYQLGDVIQLFTPAEMTGYNFDLGTGFDAHAMLRRVPGDVADWNHMVQEVQVPQGVRFDGFTYGPAQRSAIVRARTSIMALNVSGAMVGSYRLRCTIAVVGGGSFAVTSPQRVNLGVAVASGPFSNGGLDITVAPGITDYEVGDDIFVTVVQRFAMTDKRLLSLDLTSDVRATTQLQLDTMDVAKGGRNVRTPELYDDTLMGTRSNTAPTAMSLVQLRQTTCLPNLRTRQLDPTLGGAAGALTRVR